jgi:hypothetical protein
MLIGTKNDLGWGFILKEYYDVPVKSAGEF